MADLSIAQYGELYAKGIYDLLDQHEDAVEEHDEGRITEIRVEIMGVIGQLLVAAAARGRTMTDDEAALVFSDSVVQ